MLDKVLAGFFFVASAFLFALHADAAPSYEGFIADVDAVVVSD